MKYRGVLDHLDARDEFLSGKRFDEVTDVPVGGRERPPMPRRQSEPDRPARISLPQYGDLDGVVISRHPYLPATRIYVKSFITPICDKTHTVASHRFGQVS
jgi:hypothetical protein